MQLKSILGRIIIGAGLVSLVGYAFWPEALTVDIYKVNRAPMRVSINAEGKTRVVDTFVVSSPFRAYARRIELDVGDVVKTNDVICELEPSRAVFLDPLARARAESNVKAAKAALSVAEENAQATKADLDFALTDIERKKKLRANNVISQGELDKELSNLQRLEANYRSAQFAVEVAKFDLDAAADALKFSAGGEGTMQQQLLVLKAPVNGQILKKYHESESVMEAGAPILEIGDLDNLEVVVDVLSADAVQIKPDTAVEFTRWGGDYPLLGKVKRIEPVGFTKVSALGVEEQRVDVISEITSPREEWRRLGHNYRIWANFIIWTKDQVLQIPTSALFQKNNQWMVYVVEQGRAVLREVTLGESNGLQTQILTGLAMGEQIIAYPDDAIVAGAKVKPRRVQ